VIGQDWIGKSRTEIQSGFYFGLVSWELFMDIGDIGMERTGVAREVVERWGWARNYGPWIKPWPIIFALVWLRGIR